MAAIWPTVVYCFLCVTDRCSHASHPRLVPPAPVEGMVPEAVTVRNGTAFCADCARGEK